MLGVASALPGTPRLHRLAGGKAGTQVDYAHRFSQIQALTCLDSSQLQRTAIVGAVEAAEVYVRAAVGAVG